MKTGNATQKQKSLPTCLSTPVRLQSFGGAETVTGSKHLLQIGDKKLLLDCGMFQGRRDEARERNSVFPQAVLDADAVILSHAHIDHSGALPALAKAGFDKPIFVTEATRDLCEIMLADAAFIQEQDARYLAKKIWPAPEPLYTRDDAAAACRLFVGQKYGEWFEPVAGVRARFRDAGHILGSAQIEFEWRDGEQTRRLGFTGDLGRCNLPILRDPEQLTDLDFLITESTYATREHEKFENMADQLAEVINRTAARGGKIVIPAFSVERTQEIVYTLHQLFLAKKIPQLPTYVDSPLAINATEVFRKHRECFDYESYEDFFNRGNRPFTLSNLKYTREVQDSIAIDESPFPSIVIAASGMCEAGRILHHLKATVAHPKNTVLIVGFQAANTLGRALVEERTIVKIFGREVVRRCEVTVLNAFSGHAGSNELLENVRQTGAKKVFCVHGEAETVHSFADDIRAKIGCEAEVVREGHAFDLSV